MFNNLFLGRESALIRAGNMDLGFKTVAQVERAIPRVPRRVRPTMWMFTLCLLVAAVTSGCSTSRTIYSPSSTPVSLPPIGDVNIAYPGDPMLTQGTQRVYVAISINSPTQIGEFVLPAGKYLKEGESNAAEFFSWDEVSRPSNGGIVSNGQTLKSVALIKDSTSVCVQTFTSVTYCADSHQFQKTSTAVQDSDRFQRTLLYSGKVGNKINVSYREFADQFARVAFTNTAEYDLSESKVIGYKGAQVEVLEATNQYIRYRVLRNFNDAR